MTDRDQFPKTHAPEPTAHAYDNPRLGPRDFLLSVMHAPDLPIRDRMTAASAHLWRTSVRASEAQVHHSGIPSFMR